MPSTSPPNARPNDPAGHRDVQRLTQLLDAANRTIDDYAHQIASLSADLKRYRDTICASCKENVLLATAFATTPTLPTSSSPEPVDLTEAPSDPESPIRISVGKTGTDTPSPIRHGSSSSIDSDASFHTASESSTDPDPSNTTSDLPISSTPMAPVLVDYSPEIEKPLDLSVVKVFEFTDSVQCVKFSRDGRYFAAALSNEETHICDMITMSRSVLVEHGTSVFYSEALAVAKSKEKSDLWAVRFSPNSEYVATGGRNGQIKIWEMKRKRLSAIFKGHTDLVRCIDFSPDGRFLASASFDDSVRMWRVRDGTSKLLTPPMTRDFNSVAFSPDGRYVAAGNDDKHLRLWDARTGCLLKKWIGHTGFVRSVAFQPDGKGMISGGEDHTCKSWDLGWLPGSPLRSSGNIVNEDVDVLEMKEVFTCKVHNLLVTSISISSDGRWVVSSSGDSTSYIWDATTGALLCTLKGHTGYATVWAADFSQAGQYLVTGATDSKVMLWEYRDTK